MTQMIVPYPLGFYKTAPDVPDPTVATQSSACFDLHAYIKPGMEITVYTEKNVKKTFTVGKDHERTDLINLNPGDRALIPTGIIFDIPIGYSLRLYSRSGHALKKGLSLANGIGVVDCDYVEPVYAIIQNTSNVIQNVIDNERVCQADLTMALTFALQPREEAPAKKTDRNGGFGSTGDGVTEEKTSE
jgi:dUTP pyrophosphatase